MNQRVTEAAIKWWERKRPSEWTLKEHLSNPQINTVTDAEGELSKAVAEYLINSIQFHRMLDS